MVTQVAYLDASALLKLVRIEQHSQACESFLRSREHDLVSSKVVVTESLRSLSRLAPSEAQLATLDLHLTNMFLLSIDDHLVREAATLAPPSLRTLDALHVASALRMRGQVTAFVTYDHRQAAAAKLAGLPVVSPLDE